MFNVVSEPVLLIYFDKPLKFPSNMKTIQWKIFASQCTLKDVGRTMAFQSQQTAEHFCQVDWPSLK